MGIVLNYKRGVNVNNQTDLNPEPAVDTEQFAQINLVKSQTVRRRLSQTGSYFGVRPLKLINGRLSWPAIQVSAMNQI